MLTLISIAFLEKVVAWKRKQDAAMRMTLQSVIMTQWNLIDIIC